MPSVQETGARVPFDQLVPLHTEPQAGLDVDETWQPKIFEHPFDDSKVLRMELVDSSADGRERLEEAQTHYDVLNARGMQLVRDEGIFAFAPSPQQGGVPSMFLTVPRLEGHTNLMNTSVPIEQVAEEAVVPALAYYRWILETGQTRYLGDLFTPAGRAPEDPDDKRWLNQLSVLDGRIILHDTAPELYGLYTKIGLGRWNKNLEVIVAGLEVNGYEDLTPEIRNLQAQIAQRIEDAPDEATYIASFSDPEAPTQT